MTWKCYSLCYSFLLSKRQTLQSWHALNPTRETREQKCDWTDNDVEWWRLAVCVLLPADVVIVVSQYWPGRVFLNAALSSARTTKMIHKSFFRGKIQMLSFFAMRCFVGNVKNMLQCCQFPASSIRLKFCRIQPTKTMLSVSRPWFNARARLPASFTLHFFFIEVPFTRLRRNRSAFVTTACVREVSF